MSGPDSSLPLKGLTVERQLMQMEVEGINQVKMFVIITLAYLIFWGPFIVVTLANISMDWKDVKSSLRKTSSKLHAVTHFTRFCFTCHLFMNSSTLFCSSCYTKTSELVLSTWSAVRWTVIKMIILRSYLKTICRDTCLSWS